MNKPQQLNLFDQPTLNIAPAIKEAMNADMRACGRSREQVVDRMNTLAAQYGVCLTRGTSKRLTMEVFEKWLNPSDLTRQIPLKALPVFCAAVGNCSTLNVLARPMGLRVIGERDQKLLSWAEAKMAVKRHGRQIRKLEAEL